MTDKASFDGKKIERVPMLLDQSTEFAKAIDNLNRLASATRKLVEFNLELQTMAAKLKLKLKECDAWEPQDTNGKEKGLYLAVDNSTTKDVANR